MNPNFDIHLPTGPELPPPPPLDRDVLQQLQAARLGDFYQSPHYEAWLARTSEEMRNAEPFVMH